MKTSESPVQKENRVLIELIDSFFESKDSLGESKYKTMKKNAETIANTGF